MRLTFPYQTDRVGGVKVFGLQKVFELESGASEDETGSALSWGTTVCRVSPTALRAVHDRMAVVVLSKNEPVRLVEGVLAGIPHGCLVVLVSKSDRDPVDRFDMERDSMERFCRYNQRPGLIVHQSDPVLGAAMAAAGMPAVVDTAGAVRGGKGEAMIVGMALARLAGKDYVGFVDADNYVPGSITEYVNAFAANFALAETPYSMVRINWQSKPKVVDGSLFFSKFGRASEITNRFLNLYLSHLSGFGTEAIRTGNAGEHAISMALALQMRFSGGFAVEPAELVELFERFGGIRPAPEGADCEIIRKGVELYQVETVNPHFHEDKGDAHVDEMRHVALAAIHGSTLCPRWLRDEIERELVRHGVGDVAAALTPAPTYPAMTCLDWPLLADQVRRSSSGLEQFRHPDPDMDLVPRPTR